MQALPGILSLSGTLMQGMGALNAGRYNQATAEAAARDAEMTGVAQEARVRETARKAIGEQIAGQFGNGFLGGTGSALDALHESQVNAALDVLEVRRQATAKASAARSRGEIAAAEGRNAFASALIGGASGYVSRRQDWAAARAPYEGGR